MASLARRDIKSDLRCFKQKRAAAAHRVEERHAGNPSGQAQDASGEIFPQRRISRSYALAALEQGFPSGIEVKSKVAIRQMPLDGDIGLAGVHAWTAAREPADFIAHRIFDFEGGEIETR